MNLDAPLPYRLRSEIEWTLIRGRQSERWVAFDTLRSQYFRCGDEERRLLASLDGKKSLQDLKSLLSSSKTSLNVSVHSIWHIVQTAIQKQLLIPIASHGNSSTSTAPSNTAAWSTNSSSSRSIVGQWVRSIQRSPFLLVQGKSRLGDASRFVPSLAIRTDWLFSKTAVRFWMAFALISFVFVGNKLLSLESIVWPNISSIGSKAASYILLMLSTRVLHELGHAIVCYRMGARCRDFGVFFMLGIACPYVDVTDSWRLKSNHERMAVAAAGVYVEWVISAVAGVIWCCSQPGMIETFAGQVLVVCSMTTLLINANPLMRYDGYYLLSDYLEVANLREEAERSLHGFVRAWCLAGKPNSSDRWPSLSRWSFIGYAIAAWLYRATLMMAIVWAVHAITVRWEVPMLGWGFAALVLASFLLIPLGQIMVRSFSAPQQSRRSRLRVAIIWLAIMGLVSNVMWIPLPHRIACQGTVQLEDRTFVYTQAAGRIPVEAANLSVSLECDRSAKILMLENPWLVDRAQLYRQRQHQLERQIFSIRQASYQQPSKIDQLPTLQTLASIAEKQVSQATQELNSLSIAKPDQGTFIPVELPRLMSIENDTPIRQRFTIDDVESRGQWLPAGTPIGYVASSDRIEIAAVIPVSQLDHLKLGMPARVRIDQMPDRFYSAHIADLSVMTSTKGNSQSLRGTDELPSKSTATPTEAYLSISLAVDGVSQSTLAIGGTAEAVIWSQPKSLYDRAVGLYAATFGPSGSRTFSRSP
ncbi:MAG: HlyD family efflux transporter periplasmic adaptor subunit [Pirellulaceae bacterium]|nr:HlyD family efflux transporter periplasmic adaptor subunit [Pirellulaceae bacterium]